MGCGPSSELEPAGFKVNRPAGGTTAVAKTPPAGATATAPKPQAPIGKTFSLQDVQQHKTAGSAWVILHGQVFDLTKFANLHPGGASLVLESAGKDGTSNFSSSHPKDYLSRLQKYLLGSVGAKSIVEKAPSPPTPAYFTPPEAPKRQSSDSDDDASRKPRAPVFLDPAQWMSVRLMSKIDVSPNSRIFRFALPTPAHILGLPVGQHIQLRITDAKGEATVRPYTPISSNEDRGWFELLIRVYMKGDDPAHPEGGALSQQLDALQIGHQVEGSIEYKGRGVFRRNGAPLPAAERLALVAGGTGITPLYQVICRILTRASDNTKIALVYCNRTEEDILLRKELDGLQASRPNFKVWYALTKPPPEWKHGVGHIDANMMEKHLDLGEAGKRQGALALVCGRPAMVQAVRDLFKGLEIPEERVLAF